jgi:hypothetical protein
VRKRLFVVIALITLLLIIGVQAPAYIVLLLSKQASQAAYAYLGLFDKLAAWLNAREIKHARRK